ncbi:unnamed protein product [Cuscuta campestris]|uniref:Retrotransposon Copia-like N-terminal domain-containing protein n=1 Tax=Cuscuta campestris TaxID=132261 RepID=A0A484L1N9_9ASTE|nr:unnamed protein product [Cuscuta campestris]
MAELNNEEHRSTVLDPYGLTGQDNPGLALTTSKFTGANFFAWKKTITMALGAKSKLGFIDGPCAKPRATDTNYQRWIRTDSMVTCWILNSMVPELSDSFLYVNSAEELWSELVERYGHTNAPLIYQTQKELNEIHQGSMSVSAYFTKLKKYWETLQELNNFPSCECGKMKECCCEYMEKLTAIENRNKLMQFLMKLNDDYEGVCGQMLGTEPLPTLSRAFYIIQQIETQRNVTRNIPESGAFFANDEGGRMSSLKDRREDKRFKTGDRKYCKHCKSEGHLYEQYFERIGYPDWYKGKKNKKFGNTKLAAHVNLSERMEESSLESPFELNGNQNHKQQIDQELVSVICHLWESELQATDRSGVGFCHLPRSDEDV